MKKSYLGLGVLVILLIIVFINLHNINPLIGAARLELSDQKVLEIKKDEYMAAMEKGNGFNHLKSKLEQNGWKFIEQKGAGFFFERDGKQVVLNTEMWTGRYILAYIHQVRD